jgi:phenylalanine-4-hydroxylase
MSGLCRGHEGFLMYVDFKGRVGEANTDALLDALRKKCRHTLVLDSKEVPWFPRHISQLDLIANRTLDAGSFYSVLSHASFSLSN